MLCVFRQRCMKLDQSRQRIEVVLKSVMHTLFLIPLNLISSNPSITTHTINRGICSRIEAIDKSSRVKMLFTVVDRYCIIQYPSSDIINTVYIKGVRGTSSAISSLLTPFSCRDAKVTANVFPTDYIFCDNIPSSTEPVTMSPVKTTRSAFHYQVYMGLTKVLYLI